MPVLSQSELPNYPGGKFINGWIEADSNRNFDAFQSIAIDMIKSIYPQFQEPKNAADAPDWAKRAVAGFMHWMVLSESDSLTEAKAQQLPHIYSKAEELVSDHIARERKRISSGAFGGGYDW